MKVEKENKEVGDDFSGTQKEEKKKEKPGVNIKTVTMSWRQEEMMSSKKRSSTQKSLAGFILEAFIFKKGFLMVSL